MRRKRGLAHTRWGAQGTCCTSDHASQRGPQSGELQAGPQRAGHGATVFPGNPGREPAGAAFCRHLPHAALGSRTLCRRPSGNVPVLVCTALVWRGKRFGLTLGPLHCLGVFISSRGQRRRLEVSPETLALPAGRGLFSLGL